VLLSYLAGDKYVGLYQIAFKIIFALQFLPMAFMASLYPAFANYWVKNRDQLVISFERAMNYLIIISFPISIGIMVLANKIILIFKEGYDQAVLPLQITIAAILFLFLNYPVGSLLNACDKQRINTRNMGITLAFSIILNLILIPWFRDNFSNGAVGASITVVATNLLLFALNMLWVPKIIKIRPKKIISTLLKVIIAVLVMGITAFYLKTLINVFVVVAIAGIIYFVLLFLLGGFKIEDIISIWQSFRGRCTN
jgi:O-antigen/teichoic acid export membrane protein